MFQPEGAVIETLQKLDATYRFRHDTKRGIVCDIIDLTTGQAYVSEVGDTEPKALEIAAKAALTAPKPLTRAQMADPTYAAAKEMEAKLEAQEKELAELREQIAARDTQAEAKEPKAEPKNQQSRRQVSRNN